MVLKKILKLHLCIIYNIEPIYIYIFFFSLSLRIVSILTVFVNKALLSSEIVHLDAPLFVTWFQCIVSVIICIFLRKLSQWYPKYIDIKNGNPFDKDILREVTFFFCN